MSTQISVARQRATLAVLEAMAAHQVTMLPSWSAAEQAEVLLEWAKIELGLRRIACGGDAKLVRAMETPTRGVRMPNRKIKGVR